MHIFGTRIKAPTRKVQFAVRQKPDRRLQSAFKMTTIFQQEYSLKSVNGAAPKRINGNRLMDTIHSTCEFGKAHPYGK